mmetsp:Transcript_3548/g.22310  ORF Transcript_3548/g.22310 Transcript_3548/m.22310 type:complete len:91 (+) Transcript_3548:2008-2280(+)
MTSADGAPSKRWAMTTVVTPLAARESASRTSLAVRLSSEEVASSNTSTPGRRYNARAMATRCLCPPLKADPAGPTWVDMPCGKSSTNAVT